MLLLEIGACVGTSRGCSSSPLVNITAIWQTLLVNTHVNSLARKDFPENQSRGEELTKDSAVDDFVIVGTPRVIINRFEAAEFS